MSFREAIPYSRELGIVSVTQGPTGLIGGKFFWLLFFLSIVIVALCKGMKYFSYIIRRTSNFVMCHSTRTHYPNFKSLGHLILNPSPPVFTFTPNQESSNSWSSTCRQMIRTLSRRIDNRLIINICTHIHPAMYMQV